MRTADIPRPTELLPGLPDAVIDLQSDRGVQLVQGQWRYHDARIEEIDFVGVGPDLGPSGLPNRTYDIAPHAEPLNFDDSDSPKAHSGPGQATCCSARPTPM
jgi:hypothetical protein